MTDPIALLMGEHRLFERLLDALERWAERLERGDEVAHDLSAFTEVLADLVDAHHHGKEEDILFAAMVDAGFPSDVAMGGRPPLKMEAPMATSAVSLGPAPACAKAYRPCSAGLAASAPALRGPSLPFPPDGGPIAVMLHEHDLGRAHVQALRSFGALPILPVGPATTHARAFSELLRHHIQKEDNILYPMATRLLGPTMAEVGARCERYESAPETRARVSALMATANALLTRYAPP